MTLFSSVAAGALRRSLVSSSKSSKLLGGRFAHAVRPTLATSNACKYFSTKESTMDTMETGTKMYMSLYVSGVTRVT